MGNSREWVIPEGYAHNPVIKHEGQWYFFDETWADLIGPYDTEDLAREALKGYAENL